MKGLRDFRGLEKAPALEELVHGAARGLEPVHYANLLKSKSLKQISVGFGSKKKNNELRDQARKKGIEPYQDSPFSFV